MSNISRLNDNAINKPHSIFAVPNFDTNFFLEFFIVVNSFIKYGFFG